MTALLEFLSSQAWRNVVVTLLHTLWQGVLLAGVLYVVLRELPARRTGLRYALALVALMGVLVCALVTWSVLERASATTPDSAGPAATIANGQRPVESIERAPLSAEPARGAPASSSGASAPRRPGWSGWLGAGWLLGVALMLVRAILSVRGAAKLRGHARPLDDPSVLVLFDKLRAVLGLARRVRLAVCERVNVPAVLGVLWPVVLLPPAMLSGLSVEQLRAILAHELAHVRRYDYLVNLVQMLIEAMGFFNPAVWWISRQVRIEREAACDAVAAEVTGRPGALAGALADWAGRLGAGGPQVAAAFAGTRGGSLLDRVRRLASPGHRPALRISWYSLAAMLLLSAVVLLGLSRGAAVAVDAAAKLLTPEERIRRLAEVTETHGPLPGGPDSPANRVLVSGVVRMDDGAALPKLSTLTLRSRSPASSYVKGVSLATDGRFSVAIQFGEISITVKADGYAPAFAGPFRSKPGGSIEDIELVLQPGFTGRVKVVNAAGEPVSGANVTASYAFPGMWIPHGPAVVSDDTGVAALWHCAEGPMRLDVRADGYQFDRTQTGLAPDRPFTWKLRPAEPVTGVVRSAETGQPIAGAVIKLLRRSGFADHVSSQPFGEHAPTLATTNAAGRFEVTTLRDDCEYELFVTAGGHGCRFVRGVRAGREDLDVRLGPELYVRGKVTGALHKLGERRKHIHYCNPCRVGDSSYSVHLRLPVEVRDGVAHFEIRDLWAGTLTIDAGGKRVRLDLDKPIDDLLIDLAAHEVEEARRELRPVVMSFAVPEGTPAPRGTVHISFTPKDREAPARLHVYKRMEIENGRIRLDVAAPGTLRCWSRGTLGYWFKEVSHIIPAGTEPLVVEVPCAAAGAIYGQVLEADGTPANLDGANNALVGVITVKRSPLMGPGALDVPADVKAGGKFVVTPLPLGGTYRVVAHRGACYVLGEPLTLDEAEPIPEMQIRLVEGVTVPVQVLKPDGTPAAGAEVQLDYGTSHSHGFGGVGVRADRQGRVTFEHVNPDAPGHYTLRIHSRRDYRPVNMRIDPTAGAVTIHLERGRVVTGKVIDNATGRPIPGVQVYAISTGRMPVELVESEAKTNERGEFRFSNMADRDYALHGRGVRDIGQNPATAGDKAPVTLRVTIPASSRLRPAP